MIVAEFWFSDKPRQKSSDRMYAMSYDATGMLIAAISKELDNGKEPTRQNLPQQFKNLQMKGLTGEITLEGSDRTNAPYHLIQPYCANSNCEWVKR
jgi:ABC-type branched-subunit amino acid transport system substrate-binding protein